MYYFNQVNGGGQQLPSKTQEIQNNIKLKLDGKIIRNVSG